MMHFYIKQPWSMETSRLIILYNTGAVEVVLSFFTPQFVTSGEIGSGEKLEIEGKTEGGCE